MQPLLEYMRSNGLAVALESGVEGLLHFTPREIRKMLRAGDERWRDLLAPDLPWSLYQQFV